MAEQVPFNNQVTLLSAIASVRSEYLDQVKYQKNRTQEKINQATNTALFYQEALASGLKLPKIDSAWRMVEPRTITVENKLDFRIIHQIVGKLQASGMEPVDGVDGRKRLIWAYLTPVDTKFSHLRFKFQRVLARKSRCKIRKIRRKSSSYTETVVVCDRE